MTIVLFDTPRSKSQLYPFSLTKPVASIRHGIFTATEWYRVVSGWQVAILSTTSPIAPIPPGDGYLCIDSSVVPSIGLFNELKILAPGEMLEDADGIIGFHSIKAPEYGLLPLFLSGRQCASRVTRVQHPMDLVKSNAQKIISDFELLGGNGMALADNSLNRVYGPNPVIMAEGAKARGCIFNTEEGPVWIGKNALVMEGSIIRGPVAIGEGAVIKMGAQIYGGTTLGKKSTAGGEIKNSILGDFSNKAHHGYLGDSIIGEWCNLGAGTSNSNVKNNAGTIEMHSGLPGPRVKIGQKAGMVMGDFCKTAINSSVNSGTTIGVGCSIHHTGLTNKFIPSFTWGLNERYEFNKLLRDIENWAIFKQEKLAPEMVGILNQLYAIVPGAHDENHG